MEAQRGIFSLFWLLRGTRQSPDPIFREASAEDPSPINVERKVRLKIFIPLPQVDILYLDPLVLEHLPPSGSVEQ